MPLRLLPWSPEYGSGIEAGAEPPDGGAGDADAVADVSIDGPWEPRRPAGLPPPAVQIVDGVRRVEAHALDDLADGETACGLFGSYAVGAVRCDGRRATVLCDEAGGVERLRVRRAYLQAGGEAENREVGAGTKRLRYRAEMPPGAHTPHDLVAALNRRMLDEEARLAEALSADEDTLTIVDGPLRRRTPGRRVVGYVKRTYRWYLAARERALLPALAVGERTPLFRLRDGGEDGARSGGRDYTTWYLRIADLGTHVHPLAGVVRLEASGALPLGEARRLADQAALALPRLASSPVRDSRAPQNLTPVGALEALLTRRLGDRDHVRRLIARALRAAPPTLAAAPAPAGGRNGAIRTGGPR